MEGSGEKGMVNRNSLNWERGRGGVDRMKDCEGFCYKRSGGGEGGGWQEMGQKIVTQYVDALLVNIKARFIIKNHDNFS